MIWAIAYLATMPIANWMVGNVGDCTYGPCVIPMGFGLSAPSGVLMVGASLFLRDAVQRNHGSIAALWCIILGCMVSFAIAPPSLVLASVVAFAVSELSDQLFFTRLVERSLPCAVMVSGAVGAVLDSAVFLWLAFGSLDFMGGQVIGKVGMAVLAALAVAAHGRLRLGGNL